MIKRVEQLEEKSSLTSKGSLECNPMKPPCHLLISPGINLWAFPVNMREGLLPS